MVFFLTVDEDIEIPAVFVGVIFLLINFDISTLLTTCVCLLKLLNWVGDILAFSTTCVGLLTVLTLVGKISLSTTWVALMSVLD